jgi:hypothetical protein
MNENYWEGKATKPTMLMANLGLQYLPKNLDVHRSFDARIWASHFLDTLRDNPDIILDHSLMTTWFANALMRGYDEHRWGTPEYKRSVRRCLFPWWNWKRWMSA